MHHFVMSQPYVLDFSVDPESTRTRNPIFFLRKNAYVGLLLPCRGSGHSCSIIMENDGQK